MIHYEMYLRWPGNSWGGGVWNYHAGFDAADDFQALEKAAQIWVDLNKTGEFSKTGIEYRIKINQEVYFGPTARLEAVAAAKLEEENLNDS